MSNGFDPTRLQAGQSPVKLGGFPSLSHLLNTVLNWSGLIKNSVKIVFGSNSANVTFLYKTDLFLLFLQQQQKINKYSGPLCMSSVCDPLK